MNSARAGKFPDGQWDQMLAAMKSVEKADRQEIWRSDQSAAGFLPFRREILHAWHDEHHPEHRFERRSCRGHDQADRQSRVSCGILYRRLVEMFGTTVFNLDDEVFEHPMAEYKAKKGYKLDTEMTAEDWKALVSHLQGSLQEACRF